ncbi:TolC family protein, partial [Pseudomonas sp. EL_65y_Pfl1_R83]
TPAALGVPDGYSVAADTRPLANITTWWANFDDPLLASIVERARVNNLDIAQAVARLRQAREALIQSRAQLLPTLSGSAGYTRSQSIVGGTTTLPGGATIITGRGSGDTLSVGLSASYQAGLFGEIRGTIDASRAQYQASGFNYA